MRSLVLGSSVVWCAFVTSKLSAMLCRLPPIAKPYMADKVWSWDLLQCILRLADRISKVPMLSVWCSGRKALLQGIAWSALQSLSLKDYNQKL